MKNKFLKISIFCLSNLLILNIYSGSVVLKNDVANKVRFTITYRLYSPYFTEELKFIDKIESVPQDLVNSLQNLSLDETIKKIERGELKIMATLQNKGLLKKVKTSNFVLIYRKKISDQNPTVASVEILKDPNGNKYIEISNMFWQEEVKIPLENQYFTNKNDKKITSIEAAFEDNGKKHILKMNADKGWTDPCFIVKDYDKEEVEKGDIAEANVRLIKC